MYATICLTALQPQMHVVSYYVVFIIYSIYWNDLFNMK